MVWCGVVWCDIVWCGVVWCGVVWCDVVWCGVVWCGVVWCGGDGERRNFRHGNDDGTLMVLRIMMMKIKIATTKNFCV